MKNLILFLSVLAVSGISAADQNLTTAFIKLAKQVNPAIVNIRTTHLPKQPRFRDPMMEMFEQYYGINPRRQQRQPSTALGTGFIISEDGLIITNNHVIDKADEIEIQIEEKSAKTFKARVIGRDLKTDIALLKIDSKKKLPVVKLGDSSKVQVGEWVAAFGNPLGLGHSVSNGIISQKGREVAEIGIYPFLQTDASINPGNSGGPLVNLKGEVIGVNTFIIQGAQGLGFAIPIDVVKALLPQLKTKGKVARGYMGISIAPITDRIKNAFRLKDTKGVLVTDIIDGTPAAAAGIKEYDIIKKINGIVITDVRKLQMEISKFVIGTEINVELIRNQKLRTLKLSLLERKETENLAKTEAVSSLNAPYQLGFQVADITAEMAKSMGIDPVTKPVVYEIKSSSPAGRSGLAVGDIILDINRKTVNTAKQAVRALRDAPNLVKVQRGSYIIVLVIEK